MAYTVRLSRRAIRDLRHIYKSIEAETSQAAERWFRGLESAMLTLEEHPARGAIAHDDANLRHLLCGDKPRSSRIIYSIEKRTAVVNIAQIRHWARRPLDQTQTED